MLFNCLDCAKTISSKMDFCPYCKASTIKVATRLEYVSQNHKNTIGYNRFWHGTILGVLFK